MSCVKTPPLPRSLTQLIKKCIIFCMAKMIVIMDQFSRNRKYQAYGAKAKFFLTNRGAMKILRAHQKLLKKSVMSKNDLLTDRKYRRR